MVTLTMKRLLLICALALIWTVFSPSTVSAHWWGRHKKHAAADAEANPKQKHKRSRFHREHQQRDASGGLYTTGGPKTVGFWHKMPGPAGAGS